MRSNLVVMSTPGLDEHLRLSAASEPFQAQVFVAKLVVEALVRCILPWLTWIDERRINAAGAQPLKDRPRDELRAVVRTQIARCAMSADEPRQHLDDVPRANAARDLDGEALAGPLVDDGQTLQLLAVGATVVDEVIGPHVIGYRRWCRPWPATGLTPSRPSAIRRMIRFVRAVPRDGATSGSSPATRHDLDAAVSRILDCFDTAAGTL